MSNAQLPIDDRREPLLDAQSFAPSENNADRPLGPDAVAPPEPEASCVDADDPLGTDLPRAGMEAEPPRTRNRRGFSLLAVGLVAGVLVLAALAALFQSSDSDVEPAATSGDLPGSAPTPTETLLDELTADIESIQARLSQQQQERQAVTAELDALRAQVDQIQQAPGSTSQLKKRLVLLESRLEELSDVELFIERVEVRLDEQAARVTFLDEVLSGMRQQGSTQNQSASPLPRVELPFHLAAIEVWDGRLYASLLYDGRQILAQPGDECADWTVKSIDGARREVLFFKDGVLAVRRAPK